MEIRDNGDVSKSPALTMSFGSETSQQAEYECTVVFEGDRRGRDFVARYFRLEVGALRRAVWRGSGSVQSTCTATNGEANSSEVRVENITGWIMGVDGPGIELGNIAVRLQVSASRGEKGDDEASKTLSFWTNLRPEFTHPVSVD